MKFVFPIRFLALLILFLVSCEEPGIVQFHGTELTHIDYEDRGSEFTEVFRYDTAGRIVYIENKQPGIGREYDIAYDTHGRMIRGLDYDAYGLNWRDSIAYNALGQITHTYFFRQLNTIPDREYIYAYNADGELSRQIDCHDTLRYNLYSWQDGNVIRKQEYYSDELHYVFFYTYDNKVNYKRAIPYEILDPVNWSKNNVTLMEVNDYIGILDLLCGYSCPVAYTYNLDDRPVVVSHAYGRNLYLHYRN